MNHHIARALATSLLAIATLALYSGSASLKAAGHFKEARKHTFSGQYNTAIAEATKSTEAKPDHVPGYVKAYADVRAGVAYTRDRRYDLALEAYRRAIAIEPDDPLSNMSYVVLLGFMRRGREAEEHAERFLRTHPESALMKCGLAEALQRNKDYPRAHELATQCVAILESGANPGELRYAARQVLFAVAYRLYAVLAARVGDKDEAWRSIEKAASLHNDFGTQYGRAEIHYVEGSWEKALQALHTWYPKLQDAEKSSLDVVDSRFLYGQCFQQLGRWREAQGAYEEFIATNPHEKEAFSNLGLVKAKLGESDGAVADFSKALELDPKFLDARRNRGTVYLGQKRYESAIEDFSAVLAEDGDDMGTLYKRAHAYCTNEERKLGTKDLREILRIEPKNDDAKALLRECT